MADTKKPKEKSTRTLPPGGLRSEAPPSSSPSARWEEDRPSELNRTVRMDAAPRPSSRAQTLADRGGPSGRRPDELPDAESTAPRVAGKSIELFVIDESQLPGGERKPWRAAEVWTKRRVYGLDSTFKCVEILDRESGRPEPGHDMLGARLGGGRLREKDTVRFAYPLPLPGMEAMFMKGKKHGYTSAVERMIVRIRVLHTSTDEAAPTWDEIASRWSEPPPRS
jgi:hypothetical protein